MGLTVTKKDADGHLVYDGLLSSEEICTADKILKSLKKRIPRIESDLEKTFGKGVLYKYYLGKSLGKLISRYNISPAERRKFWCEIKRFATKESRTRKETVNRETGSFYGQCYELSQLDLEIVKKLAWHQWQDFLDRVNIKEDIRIYEWIRNREKFNYQDWREFLKGLTLYLKNSDTSVFTEEELYEIYDSILNMGKYWRTALSRFSKVFPQSAKLKSKVLRSHKYQAKCFQLRRELRKPLDDDIFEQSFRFAMDMKTPVQEKET